MPGPQELVFAPLGGVGEIGMNLSIYGVGDERRRTWLAVDLGVSFASEEHLPGVDLILPDIRYLVEERKNVVGLVLTHAHEDHFGALIDLWPRLKIPVYATPFTAALLEAKCAGEPGAPKIPVTVVALGSRFEVGPFNIELVTMAHSIPESNALIIRTSGGTVLHTGDWKIDPTPILRDPTDEKKLRALGEEGCLALVGDSTNAVRDGRSQSEADVAKTLAELVRTARGRVAVTTCGHCGAGQARGAALGIGTVALRHVAGDRRLLASPVAICEQAETADRAIQRDSLDTAAEAATHNRARIEGKQFKLTIEVHAVTSGSDSRRRSALDQRPAIGG